MAKAKSVWGIDIGQCALKALKLREVEGELHVEGFDVIDHPKILSEPEINKEEIIREALEQFISRNDLGDSSIAVSVPGQSSFTRFVKLPPVDPKKIPDIVRFEAEQQIPFPIDDVIWRWQTFRDPDSPDVETGIFAMKKVDVTEVLDHFSDADILVDHVQIAPLGLYNFMTFDEQVAEDGATLLADIGANKTDLVVSDGSRIWTRTIQIGGNNFTEALVRSFKLSFAKAEKLKRSAATSKYARQIFQAMRPVFSDLVQEIQRSIGYYTSLHRETRLKKLIGLGNGFRLPGLQKFLEQNLNVQVARVDAFNRLTAGAGVNEPKLNESVLSLGVAYGLAVQGLELAKVETNLLPKQITRRRMWSNKKPWFVAAAAVLLLALISKASRPFMDRGDLAPSPELRESRTIVDQLDKLVRDYNGVKNQGKQEEQQLRESAKLFGYRDFWPSVQTLVSKSIQEVATDQGSLSGGAEALEQLKSKPRQMRQLIFVTKLTSVYLEDITAETGTTSAGRPGRQSAKRGYRINIEGRTPLPKAQANAMLSTLSRKSRGIAEQLKSLSIVKADLPKFKEITPSVRASIAGGAEVVDPDPIFPGESMASDTHFEIGWVIQIEGDGIELPDTEATSSGRR